MPARRMGSHSSLSGKKAGIGNGDVSPEMRAQWDMENDFGCRIMGARYKSLRTNKDRTASMLEKALWKEVFDRRVAEYKDELDSKRLSAKIDLERAREE